MESLSGQLLIAPAHLSDPNFSHSVVLMLQHDPDGAFGVVLNRPTAKSIREVWEQVRETACQSRQRVHAGGPVAGPLVAIHCRPEFGDAEIMPGVFCTTAPEHLESLVEVDPDPVRFYAGYSGWGGGQLEGELQLGSWLTVRATADDVFNLDGEGLWRDAFRRASGSDDAFPIDPAPGDGDPSLN